MINVVGSGIAGSLVTRLLRKNGHKVRVIDDNDAFSASRASSNLYIASWLKKFSSADASRGIDVLESLFPQDQIDQPFSKGIADAMKVRHISQRYLLVQPDIDGEARIEQGSGQLLVGDRPLEGPVVLCVGHREWQFVHDSQIDVLAGHCVLLEGDLKPGQSSLTMPLPYKHYKLYQLEPGKIYFANSTALQRSSFNKRAESLRAALESQARAAVGDPSRKILEYRVGYRPISKGNDFGYLKNPFGNVYTINGGGKNGLVAYAKLAADFLEKVRH